MKKSFLLLLVGAVALLVSGCYAYGPGPAWNDERPRQFQNVQVDGEQAPPCLQDGRRPRDGRPCPYNP